MWNFSYLIVKLSIGTPYTLGSRKNFAPEVEGFKGRGHAVR